jgi:hypothetical protein
VKHEYGIETKVSDRHAQTIKQKKHSSGKPPVMQLIADVIDVATTDSPTLTTFIARLQQAGVAVYPRFEQERFHNGIAYQMNDVSIAGYFADCAICAPRTLLRGACALRLATVVKRGIRLGI